MSALRDAAVLLGGEIVGGQVLAPGPNHSARDRSLAVRFDANAPGGFKVYSHAGDPWQACRDHVSAKLGSDDWRPSRSASVRLVHATNVKATDVRDASILTNNGALRQWEQSVDPTGTPVDLYLKARGVDLPCEAVAVAIRWHPACPFGPGLRVGCMVALVRDIRSNAPLGIHRTALDAGGRKLDELGANGRLSLGPVGGGAVKLTADENVTQSVGIGEGIETALSLRNLDGCCTLSVWALLSAGQLKAFPLLPGIESLWIAADHDPAGILAARGAAARWNGARREVVQIVPEAEGWDLNDVRRRDASG